MTIAQQIAVVLEQIEKTLERIQSLRQEAESMRVDEEQARKDYQEVVGQANRESERLEAEIDNLQRKLRPAIAAPPAAEVLAEEVSRPLAPVVPPAPPERVERLHRNPCKLSIADHVASLAAPESDPVVERINSMLKDPACGPGEMLELIGWGDIWKQTPEWEPEEDRLNRLSEWGRELVARLAYWEAHTQGMEADRDYELGRTMRGLSPEAWQDYLAGSARDRQAENVRLSQQLDRQREKWNLWYKGVAE